MNFEVSLNCAVLVLRGLKSSSKGSEVVFDFGGRKTSEIGLNFKDDLKELL